MSDAIDTDMVDDALRVLQHTRSRFRRRVLRRVLREMDWTARARADEVMDGFDALRYAARQCKSQPLQMLGSLEYLGLRLQRSMDWSSRHRPFDLEAYERTFQMVSLAHGAICSALGIYKRCGLLGRPWDLGS